MTKIDDALVALRKNLLTYTLMEALSKGDDDPRIHGIYKLVTDETQVVIDILERLDD